VTYGYDKNWPINGIDEAKDLIKRLYPNGGELTFLYSSNKQSVKRTFAEFKDMWNSLINADDGRETKIAIVPLGKKPTMDNCLVWVQYRDGNPQIICETLRDNAHNPFAKLMGKA